MIIENKKARTISFLDITRALLDHVLRKCYTLCKHELLYNYYVLYNYITIMCYANYIY